MKDKNNPLIGKTITGLKIATDRQALLFQTTDGDLIVRVTADCCSYTWIESVELPAFGFPALVTAVEDLELPNRAQLSDFRKNTEVVAVFRGRTSIVMELKNRMKTGWKFRHESHTV